MNWKSEFSGRIQIAHVAVIASLTLLVPAGRLLAQAPPGCTPGGLGALISITTPNGITPLTAHVGDTLTITRVAANLSGTGCNLTNGGFWVTYPSGDTTQAMSGFNLLQGQEIQCLQSPTAPSCLSIPTNYVVKEADLNRNLLFVMPRGNGCARSGQPKTVHFLVSDEADLVDSSFTAAGCGNVSVAIIKPGIACAKFCTNGIGQFGAITYGGFVTNTGDTPLFNVSVSNLVNGVLTLITNIATLEIGEKVSFSGSYVPANACVPTVDTIFVRGSDITGLMVTSQCTATCQNVLTPGLLVTKNCPSTPTQPGTPLVYSGIVSNSGNVTLTNVIVINNQPAPNTPVLGPITLAPGASTAFTNSYIIPLDSCGPYPDTLTARATTICGVSLTNTATAICPGTNSPSIDVTKSCPAGLVQPGGVMLVSGTVTNTGNITLTNVVVTNSISALGVSRIVFGPVTLAPGAGATFTDSYIVPLDSCGPYADTFAAFGADKCFGRVVTDSATAICPGTNSPSIDVTKVCPQGLIQPGGTVVVTGTVTNTGNITLTNVVVTNSITALGVSRRVFGPVTLAPGGGATFTDTYVVPLDSCGPYADTFAAFGADKCFGRVVTDTASVACPGTNSPSIDVTKSCPQGLIQPGQTLIVSGTVTNTGNITLTNIVVTNNIGVLGISRRVFGPVTLAPGGGATFTDSYVIPLDSCGPYPDTFAAFGADKCFGRIVTDSAAVACPGTNSPSIDVTKSCPAGLVQPGGVMLVNGTVTNTGNITLTNVVVTNSISALGVSRIVFGPVTLAPGAGATFTDSYIVPLDSCGPYADTFAAFGADKCFGRIVADTATVACPGTNSPSIDVTKACPQGLIQPGGTVLVTGTVTNTGNITLTNVVVTNNISVLGITRRVFGPVNLAPGAGATFTDSYVVPLDSCGPYADTFLAFGADKCFGRIVTDNASVACPGTNTPSIDVTKNCPQGLIQPGGTVVVTGNIVNTGNITLTNVVVTNHIAALGVSRRVFGPVNLAPGVGANFSDTYVVPLDSCGPYADTFAAYGADKCFGRIVTDSATVACPGTNSPGIAVFKNCPQNPVPPGGLMIVTGFVTNTGNITLTNVSVTNVIAAIGQTRRVFGPVNLPPGGSASFSDSYIVPPNTCGPYRDTFLASGADKCFGRIVTASDFKDCPGITTPRIAVTKQCPPSPVAPGGIAVFSGTVSNAGNITLTNVYVVNNRPTNNTPVIGPITLLPGQSTNFSGSYTVPANCCSYFDTLTASGNSFCTGSNVTASATAVCPTVTTPQLVVTKRCPPNPVPHGQPLVFSGIVSNAGNITLVGVTVVDNLPTNNTPVFGPITLAPGESAEYIGSHIVPINTCSPTISDTVTARGTNICNGSNVTATATAVCPIVPIPRLSLIKICPPNPVAPGQLLIYSGIVSNSGTVTITNVFVVNDRPVLETPVIGPITLAPGQSTNFTGSYLAPYDCCGPCVDTLTARGKEFCTGSNVVATASAACPRITTPGIRVTRDCPPGPPTLGDLVFVTGIVSNSGNATLVNVRLVDDQAGVIMDSAALAPGEAVWYLGMFITTNCGPSIPAGITATANDACFSASVTNRFTTTCGVVCPSNLPVVLLDSHVEDGNFLFSFQTEVNKSYKIQFTPTIGPETWQDLATLPGTGGILTVSHNASAIQGFYRVVRN